MPCGLRWKGDSRCQLRPAWGLFAKGMPPLHAEDAGRRKQGDAVLSMQSVTAAPQIRLLGSSLMPFGQPLCPTRTHLWQVKSCAPAPAHVLHAAQPLAKGWTRRTLFALPYFSQPVLGTPHHSTTRIFQKVYAKAQQSKAKQPLALEQLPVPFPNSF